jgi:hypothetical protein
MHALHQAFLTMKVGLMHAIKSARQLILKDPTSKDSEILSSLVLAVQSEGNLEIARLYELDIESFELAISVLKEWRLDRYYAGKAKLFDMAMQVRDLPQSGDRDSDPATRLS